MVQINESMFRPVLDFIEQRQKNSVARLAELGEEKKRLKRELKQITLSSPIGKETTC